MPLGIAPLRFNGKAVQFQVELHPTLAGDAQNSEWQRDLSVSHNKIGDVRVAQGDLAAALEAFQKGLDIATRLAVLDPSNAQWQGDLIFVRDRIARLGRPA